MSRPSRTSASQAAKAPGARVRKVRIFVSSPGDVPDERASALAVVQRLSKDQAFRDHLDLDPILWDDPEGTATMVATLTPQEGVNRSLYRPSQCEIVVTVLWSRLGTPLTKPLRKDGTQYLSGTVWEFEDATRVTKTARPEVLLYRCTREPKVSLRDPGFDERRRQFGLVDQFFERFKGPGGGKTAGYAEYDSPEDFAKALERDLRALLPQFIGPGRTPAATTSMKRGRSSQAPSAKASLVVPDAYREWLRRETASVETLGIGGARGRSFVLSSVYVPLTTAVQTKLETARSGRPRAARLRAGALPDDGPRFTTLLGRLDDESLVVPAGPGVGKSTFCRWVAWLVASGAMPAQEPPPPDDLIETFPESLRDTLPVLVPLREFWTALPMRPTGGKLAVTELAGLLARWLKHRDASAEALDLEAFLHAGRVALLLDGIDEVPTAHPEAADVNPRQILLSALRGAVRDWTTRRNRVLATSRPNALSTADFDAIGLPIARVEPLSDDMQSLLTRRWFRIQKQDDRQGDAIAGDLMRDIGARGRWLGPLAANPLMLTAMCVIYADGRKLPQDRHQLYDRIVESVLTTRYDNDNRRRRARFELGAIAHAMHTGAVLGVDYPQPLAVATHHECAIALREGGGAKTALEAVLGPRDALDDLLAKSGLLTDASDQQVQFAHFSIQEFLAAEREYEREERGIRDFIVKRWAVPQWRNTLSFLFGRVLGLYSDRTKAIALLETMVEQTPSGSLPPQAVLADCLEMLMAQGYSIDPARLARLQAALLQSLANLSTVSERCDAGTLLGKIGDPRFDQDRWYLPLDDCLGFEVVPEGSFVMGSRPNEGIDAERPQHPVTLEQFFVARYPVTVAQFGAYLQASSVALPGPERFRGVANHPVVNVSWHEARGYCAWLTEGLRAWKEAPPAVAAWLDATIRAGWAVTLPTEAEWEKAARGDQGRVYPWEGPFDPAKANTRETQLGTTSAVGAFPRGVSVYGAHDMSGNVWEWTRSLWVKYPYQPGDSRERLDAADSVLRVVRGGSFGSSGGGARAAARLRSLPVDLSGDVGFRVVVSRSRT